MVKLVKKQSKDTCETSGYQKITSPPRLASNGIDRNQNAHTNTYHSQKTISSTQEGIKVKGKKNRSTNTHN